MAAVLAPEAEAGNLSKVNEVANVGEKVDGDSGGKGNLTQVSLHKCARKLFCEWVTCRNRHATDNPNLTAKQAVEQLGVTTPPNKVIPIEDNGNFVPNRPNTVQPHPLWFRRWKRLFQSTASSTRTNKACNSNQAGKLII